MCCCSPHLLFSQSLAWKQGSQAQKRIDPKSGPKHTVLFSACLIKFLCTFFFVVVYFCCVICIAEEELTGEEDEMPPFRYRPNGKPDSCTWQLFIPVMGKFGKSSEAPHGPWQASKSWSCYPAN